MEETTIINPEEDMTELQNNLLNEAIDASTKLYNDLCNDLETAFTNLKLKIK